MALWHNDTASITGESSTKFCSINNEDQQVLIISSLSCTPAGAKFGIRDCLVYLGDLCEVRV